MMIWVCEVVWQTGKKLYGQMLTTFAIKELFYSDIQYLKIKAKQMIRPLRNTIFKVNCTLLSQFPQ